MDSTLRVILSRLLTIAILFQFADDNGFITFAISAESGVPADKTGPLNATYLIDDQEIQLVNGNYEKVAAPGSTTKIKATIISDPVYGILNREGDAALLLSYDPGGSGTFYYISVALNIKGRYQGTNAVLLGDRITPLGIMIRDQMVIAYYADRLSTEPMSALPSIGTSRYWAIKKGKLEPIKPTKANQIFQENLIAQELGRKVLAVNEAIHNPIAPNAMQAITDLGLDSRYYVLVRGWLSQKLQGDMSLLEANKERTSSKVTQRITFLQNAIRAIDLE